MAAATGWSWTHTPLPRSLSRLGFGYSDLGNGCTAAMIVLESTSGRKDLIAIIDGEEVTVPLNAKRAVRVFVGPLDKWGTSAYRDDAWTTFPTLAIAITSLAQEDLI